MEGWEETTLEKCVSVLGDGLHGTPKYTADGEYAFINGNNLCEGKIIIKPDTKRVDRNEYEKHKKPLNERTVLVSINGTLGNVGTYHGEKVILGKSACYFNVLETVDKDFIKYIVSTPYFKKHLEANATGTTIKNFSLKQMREYKFLIPPLEEQIKISSFLSLLDQQIEVYESINSNLLSQGETVFREVYCKGEDAILEQLIEVVETGTRPKGGAESSGIPSIGAEKIERFGIYDYEGEKYISEEFFDNMKRGIVSSGDVLLYKDGAYTGKVSMALDDFPHKLCAVNEHVFILRTPQKSMQFYLYFCLSREDIKKKVFAIASGKAAQPGLNKKELMGVDIKLPPIGEIKAFEDTISPLMHLVAKNAMLIKSLRAEKNSLLQKIMTGDIDVSSL